MRSLWRDLALQWLGGEASEGLTATSSFLDRFPIFVEPQAPAFIVERAAGVSHQAMLRASDDRADAALPLPSA
jgi:hypothetical protein